ncbi:hypothetical protein [Streptomyces sp. NPDC046805]|uniref:hypothetical protein n=1 Tax=Streptomyces sp. NPDC046805 TaxID=3155134 RepID=UPI0033D9AA17
MQTTGPGQRALQTPRAAALAGIVFALLLAAAIVLIRLSVPEGAGAQTASGFTDATQRAAVRAAIALVPFAGIFFLWFVGVVRSHVGEAEDRFLTTVFLGSGLIFVATMYAAAAAAGAVLATGHPPGTDPGLPTWNFGRHLAYSLITGYAMRMAAVFTCSLSLIAHRLGVLPRWLTVLGFLTTLTLLFVSSNVRWAEMVFPAWCLVLSTHLLVVGGRPAPDMPAAR